MSDKFAIQNDIKLSKIERPLSSQMLRVPEISLLKVLNNDY